VPATRLATAESFKSPEGFHAVARAMGLFLRHLSTKDLRQLATKATAESSPSRINVPNN
jgi:hypothetical protein